MKLPIENIKLKLESILFDSCAFEFNNQISMRKCVDAVKKYLSTIKAIKSYRVNCHGDCHKTIGTIARLTVEITPHEGKTVELKLELWPAPFELNFDEPKKKKLTSRR